MPVSHLNKPRFAVARAVAAAALAVACAGVGIHVVQGSPLGTGQLLGVNSPLQLVSISVRTGKLDPVGAVISDMEGIEMQLSAWYRTAGLFYIVGWNSTSAKPNLISINLSGFVHSNVELPLAEAAFVGVGQSVDVDEATGHVYVSGRFNETGAHHLLEVDPMSGKYQSIAALGDNIDVLSASSAYDANTQSVFLMYGVNTSGVIDIDLFAVNVKSGAITKIDMESDKMLSAFTYDATSGNLIGTGIRPINATAWDRTIVSFDPKTSTFTTLGTVGGGYKDMLATGVAIDEVQRELYVLMQLPGKNVTVDPFDLVSLSAATGALVRAEPCCHFPQACPWSMIFSN